MEPIQLDFKPHSLSQQDGGFRVEHISEVLLLKNTYIEIKDKFD
jgi:hypothetical protein